MKERDDLMNQLAEEKSRSETSTTDQLCLLPGFCFTAPQFGGWSSGILVLGLGLGLALGCFCAGRCNIDLCAVCKCCCPASFGSARTEDDDQDIHIHLDGSKPEEEVLKAVNANSHDSI